MTTGLAVTYKVCADRQKKSIDGTAHAKHRGTHVNHPANTIHCPGVCLMLGQRRRRWTNIKETVGQRLVFAGRWPRPDARYYQI